MKKSRLKKLPGKWWVWLLLVIIIIFILFFPLAGCWHIDYGFDGMPLGGVRYNIPLILYLLFGC